MMSNENYQDLILMDPSQMQLLNQIDANELLLLDSPSEDEALHTIGKQLKHNLSQCKKTILVVEKKEDIPIILNQLARQKISKYCLEISHLTKLTQKESTRLKLWCKKPAQNLQALPIHIHIEKAKKHKDQLKQSYRLITAKIFGDQNWLEMVDRAGVSASNYSKLYCLPNVENIDLEYTQNEYWQLKGRIQKLAESYNEAYLDIERQIDPHPNIFQDYKYEEILELLSKYKREAAICLKELHQYLKTYQLKHESSWRQKLHILKTQINEVSAAREELNWKETNHSVELGQKLKSVFGSGSSKLQKEKNQLYTTIEKIQKSFRDANIEESIVSSGINDLELIQTQEFQELISEWIAHTDNWEMYQKRDMDRNISRMNKYNSSDQELKDIEDKLETLISDINDKNLFTKKFEDHSLSSIKKLSFLRELLHFINTSISTLKENPAFCQWFIAMTSLNDKMRKIYEMVVSIPVNEWIPAFDAWYFNKLVSQHSIINIPQDSRPLKDWLSSIEHAQLQLDNYLDGIWLEKRLNALDALKNKNKIIHVSLFKKKHVPEFSWIDLFTADAESMSDIYPILILDQETLQEFNMIQGVLWDHIYHFQFSNLDHVNFKLSKKLASHHVVNFNSEHSDNFLTNKNLKNTPKINLLETLSLSGPSGLSDRLRKSRKIATHLNQTGGSCRIFQLKQVLIISFLSPLKNQLIMSTLKDAGIKELNPMEDAELVLQDSLIDRERKWVIFTQEGLLELQNFENLAWQLHLIHVLKEKEAKIFSIWSLQNMEHWGTKIFHYCQMILSMNGEAETKQLTSPVAG